MKKVLLILCLAALSAISAQTSEEIKQIFEETRQLLQTEEAKMWGVDLYGPIMFVDQETRKIYANEQDLNSSFTESGGVFEGNLDYKVNIANTTIKLNGKQWTMVMLPLSGNVNEKRVLVVHELFHSAQNKLNLQYRGSLPAHLEKRKARELLRLEWAALFQALQAGNHVERKHNIQNALIFRDTRRMLFPGADMNENCFELGEGLAEYTGIALGIKEDTARINYLIKASRMMLEDMKPVVRSFGYISGSLYALLLDKSDMHWRKQALPDTADLGMLIRKAFSISVPSPDESTVSIRKKEYDYGEIELSESEREKENNRKTAVYKKTFIDSPVLRIPLYGGHIRFNPMEVVSLDSLGTVYPTLRVTGKWGVLTVEKGSLMQPDWVVAVTLPFGTEGSVLTGEGWKLELNEGWTVIKEGESYIMKKAGNENQLIR